MKLSGDQLRVDFGAAAVVATLKVIRSPQYVALSLVSVSAPGTATLSIQPGTYRED